MAVIMACETDANDSLSPVIRGEGWGEGTAACVSQDAAASCDAPVDPPSPPPSPRKRTRGAGVCLIALLTLASISVVARAATPTSKPTSKETTQQFCLPETDPN